MSRILLVEDERHLAEGLAFNLRNSGYDVEIFDDGEAMLEAAKADSYDLLLLDIMLPGIDGLEVARRLRQAGHLQPIVMVSARDRADDTIRGLDAGADDYITKPYDLDEVLARIRGALRRQVWGRTVNPPEIDNGPEGLAYGSWTIDFQTFLATRPRGKEVRLSPREIAMLKLFASRPGEVISRRDFLEEVWGLSGEIESRTVDNFIRKLRQALEDKTRRATTHRVGAWRRLPFRPLTSAMPQS